MPCGLPDSEDPFPSLPGPSCCPAIRSISFNNPYNFASDRGDAPRPDIPIDISLLHTKPSHPSSIIHSPSTLTLLVRPTTPSHILDQHRLVAYLLFSFFIHSHPPFTTPSLYPSFLTNTPPKTNLHPSNHNGRRCSPHGPLDREIQQDPRPSRYRVCHAHRQGCSRHRFRLVN